MTNHSDLTNQAKNYSKIRRLAQAATKHSVSAEKVPYPFLSVEEITEPIKPKRVRKTKGWRNQQCLDRLDRSEPSSHLNHACEICGEKR
jgi:hypothetical protein